MIGYPVYAPPHPHNEIELPAGKARENFDYFLQQRPVRLQCLRDFMKKFGVDAATTDDGLTAVSDWFARYGGLLLHFENRSAATLQAFINHDPPWTGEHIGINVVWDLATFVGECVIARRPSAHWDMNTGDPEPVSLEALGFQRPCVGGLGWPPYCDPISQIFMDSHSKSRHMRIGYGRGMSFGNLVDHVAVWSRGIPPNPTLMQRAEQDSAATPAPRRAARRPRRSKPQP
jgi:hypothetical protein